MIYLHILITKGDFVLDFLWFLSGLRNGFLDKLFLFITSLGEETAFMAIAIVVFWCISKKDGYYILSVGFLGTVFNQFLKLLVRIERPWVLDSSFKAVEEAIPEATGYSFPSGHTQNSVGTFGSLAYKTKRAWLKIIFVAICILVPFSRMYLGVHTPLDVFVSICVALLLIFYVKPLIDKIYDKEKYLYIFLGAMAVISILYLVFAYNPPFSTVEAYQQSGIKNGHTLLGALLGMLVATPVERHLVKFETSGKWYTQVFKCVVGLPLVLGILEGFKLVLDNLIPVPFLGRTIRYFLVVLFATLIYPISFKLFKRLEVFIENKRNKKEA